MSSFAQGFSYFFQGFRLIFQKGLRHLVIIPFLINSLLFVTLFSYATNLVINHQETLVSFLPSWLNFLDNAIVIIVALLVLVITYLNFIFLANWIGAPFYGLLAEKVEMLLLKQPLPQTNISTLITGIPKALLREWQKLSYFFPKLLAFLILFFLFPGIGQLLWILFSIWLLAIQYSDYAFDNHNLPFSQTKYCFKKNRLLSLGFGSAILVIISVPIVNLLTMPIAICGGTILWVKHYRQHYLP